MTQSEAHGATRARALRELSDRLEEVRCGRGGCTGHMLLVAAYGCGRDCDGVFGCAL